MAEPNWKVSELKEMTIPQLLAALVTNAWRKESNSAWNEGARIAKELLIRAPADTDDMTISQVLQGEVGWQEHNRL